MRNAVPAFLRSDGEKHRAGTERIGVVRFVRLIRAHCRDRLCRVRKFGTAKEKKLASPERGDSPRGGEMLEGQRGLLSTRGTAVRRWRGLS